MHSLSVVIITYNEEKNIGQCIRSVSKVANEIIVLDSFSDDDTVNIAVALGAMVTQSAFDGYIRQKNKAIELASNNYVLLLDADEALSNELCDAILEEKKSFGFKAYTMKRCNIFCGTAIKHGLWYPDKKLRLFDKRLGNCGGLDPHDKIIMHKPLKVKLLKGDLMHFTFNSVKEYQYRNDQISTVAAQSLYDAGIKRSPLKIIISPLWAFINGYFFRMGFLEGYKGLLIALLTAQQTYLKYYKLRQLQRQHITEIVYEQHL
jgi:glycosyltransferase involved in cell wall biosynthesis